MEGQAAEKRRRWSEEGEGKEKEKTTEEEKEQALLISRLRLYLSLRPFFSTTSAVQCPENRKCLKSAWFGTVSFVLV